MLRVRSSDRDDPKVFYGNLYGDRRKSEWRACGKCGFVHQNPRPSEEALQEFFRAGDYHKSDIPAHLVSRELYLRHTRSSYFHSKTDYFLAHSQLSGGRVFDVGCGAGSLLYLLSEEGFSVAGCEPDPVHCEFAAKYNPDAEVGQYLLTECETPDGKFDAVISHHVFEHFADLNDAMKGVVAILKPGGYVFTVVPTYYRNRTANAIRAMNAGHYSMFTHDTMNRLFSGFGLEEVIHTYRGAWAWSDELWHLARFTGNKDYGNTSVDANAVQYYVNEVTRRNEILGLVTYAPFRAMWKIGAALNRRLRPGSE